MKWLIAICFLFSANISLAECRASSFLTDRSDGFSSQQASFDWCFKRVNWWELDNSRGWQDRYCRSSRYSSGYNQWKWDGRFWHKHRDYSSRYPSGLFTLFSNDYNYSVFRGWSGRIEFRFEKECSDGGYGYDGLPEVVD